MAEIDVKDLTLLGNLQQGDKVVGERVDGTTVRLQMPYNTMTGTLNRLTITNGDGNAGNPIFDISSSYIGQSSITTLGTITTGVWNATILSASYGGSGRSSATAYAPICGGTTATGAQQSSPNGSTGQLYVSQGSAAVPIWTTPTYPVSSGTLGKFLISDGTNNIYSTSTIPTSAGATANKHLKSDGTNYVLTTATISDTPSTAGKRLISDGTNWVTSNTSMADTGTNNKVLIGNGTNYVESTPTVPFSSSATSRKIIVSDGTNWIASTETYATPGSSKNYLKSDGTNWTSAAPDTTPVASTLAGWDSNSNLSANNFLHGYTSTATAAGTTTLTVASTVQQVFTGSTTQTCKLPVVSTLALGTSYIITNLSSGVVTVQSSGANTIQAMAANTTLIVQSNATSGTGASVWNVIIYTSAASDITGSGSLVRATSPTMTGITSDQISWSNTTKGIIGTTTNDNAASSYVGEYISASAGSTGISNNTATNIITQSLTAGDWIVWGVITFVQAAGTTASVLISSISTTSATLGSTNSYPQISGVTFSAGSTNILPAAPVRVSLSGTSNVYLVGYTTFAVSTMSTTGGLYAWRRR